MSGFSCNSYCVLLTCFVPENMKIKTFLRSFTAREADITVPFVFVGGETFLVGSPVLLQGLFQ